MPADCDVSLEANIVRVKCFRNELCHSVSTRIAKDKFEDKWNIVSSALVAMGLDQTEVDRLKSEPIDHDTKRRIEEEVNKWKLADCLPDEVMNFFGRSQEMEQVMQHIMTRKVGIVLITGGPGFGKTTVAKKSGARAGSYWLSECCFVLLSQVEINSKRCSYFNDSCLQRKPLSATREPPTLASKLEQATA